MAVVFAVCGAAATLVDLPVARFFTAHVPAGNVPAGNVPAGNVPAGNVPAGNVPAGNVPAGNRPAAADARVDDAPANVPPEQRHPRGSRRLPGDLVRILNLSEVFGYSPSAAIILLAAMLLDPSLLCPRKTAAAGHSSDDRAPAGQATCRVPLLVSADAMRMVCMTFTGGLTTDLVKLVVTRVRPYAARLDLHATAIDTFSNIEGVGGAAMRSFPSGHAAVAAGLASALCWRYPRGAPLFIVIATAAAAQRLTSCSHFVSDVAVGAAIAVAWAAFWVRLAERANPG